MLGMLQLFQLLLQGTTGSGEKIPYIVHRSKFHHYLLRTKCDMKYKQYKQISG